MDLYLFQQINQFAGKYFWLDAIGIFFAKYLGYVLIVLLLLFLLKNFKKYWPIIAQALGAGVLARLVIVNIIRWLWERPRPFTLLSFGKQNLGGFVENGFDKLTTSQIHQLISHSATPSFPSGHAAFYFAISTIVYFYNKKAGYLFFVASFLISISRVFSGIHWPSDILVGAVVGILSGWLINRLTSKFFQK